MALIRWQPFQEIETLRRQMDQMFDEVMGSERKSATSWQPAIELQDTEDNLVLRTAIPGVDGKDIDVHITREAIGTKNISIVLSNLQNIGDINLKDFSPLLLADKPKSIT